MAPYRVPKERSGPRASRYVLHMRACSSGNCALNRWLLSIQQQSEDDV